MREYMNKTDNNNKTPDHGKQVTSKQVVAIVGVLLLVLLYIVTLIVAIFDSSESGRWFISCIFATVAVPILLWIYIWMYGKLTGKPTMTDSKQVTGIDICADSDTATDNTNVSDNITDNLK